jgi:hypothetical protein
MCNWVKIGYSLEAKIVDSTSIWIRQENQVNVLPHSIVKVENGNITDIKIISKHLNPSVEGNAFIISLVKTYLNQIQNC